MMLLDPIQNQGHRIRIQLIRDRLVTTWCENTPILLSSTKEKNRTQDGAHLLCVIIIRRKKYFGLHQLTDSIKMERQSNVLLLVVVLVGTFGILALVGSSSWPYQGGVRKLTTTYVPEVKSKYASVPVPSEESNSDADRVSSSANSGFEEQASSSISNHQGFQWDDIPCPNTTNPCDLTDMTYGVPVILVSAGRSGTSVTWNLMSELSVPEGHYHQIAYEDLGGSTHSAKKQLNALGSEHGKCWLERHMCKRQFTNMGEDKGSAIYGPKWKTSETIFEHPKAQEALAWLGDTPSIRVVYNTRNILDLYLSRLKHELYPDLTSHCGPDDTECINMHKEAEANMVVPVDDLIHNLGSLEEMNNYMEAQLDKYHVPRVHVEYDNLYYAGEDMTEWERLFKFMGVGPKRLTRQDLLDHMVRGATSSSDQREKMANYDEVSETLKGTRFEKLLRH